MTILNEGRHTGEFLISPANGERSLSNETMSAVSAAVVVSGTVVGKITADDKFRPYAPGNGDGSEVAGGISYTEVDASTADVACGVVVRDAEVARNRLTGLDAGAETALAALGIIVRDEY